MADDYSNNTSTTGRLTIGAAVPAAFELAHDADWFAVDLDAGKTYWFNLLGANEGKGSLSSAYFDHKLLRVLDADGHELATTGFAWAYGATAPTLAFVPQRDGAYYVEAASHDDRTGTYQLQARLGVADDVGNDLAHAAKLASGKPTTGSLEIPSDHDVFRFHVASDGSHVFQLNGAGGQQNVSLLAYGSNGQAVPLQHGSLPDRGQLFQLDHLPAGDYYLDVQANLPVQTNTPHTAPLPYSLSEITLSVSHDPDGHAGQAYRLYQAAFNRLPDVAGLGFWMDRMDKGESLHDVANAFVGSAEFVRLYGQPSRDTDFVAQLYHNALHRDGEAAGFLHWVGLLGAGMARADVLIAFSESAENQAAVIGQISHGIDYLPFG